MAEAAPETVELLVGEERKAITIRRPTHGELDVAMLGRLLSVVVNYQKRIATAEDAPEAGVSVKVANLLGLIDDAISQMATRVRRALAATSAPEVLGWLDEGGELARANRTIDVAIALVVTLAPAARLPK